MMCIGGWIHWIGVLDQLMQTWLGSTTGMSRREERREKLLRLNSYCIHHVCVVHYLIDSKSGARPTHPTAGLDCDL